MLTFDLDFKELETNLSRLSSPAFINSIAKEALHVVAKQIQKDSKPLVPKDTKDLVNSWKVENSGTLSLEAGYDIIYAMYQHQGVRSDGTHIIRNRPAGGESFFLKKPIDRNLKSYYKMYAKEIETQLSKFL